MNEELIVTEMAETAITDQTAANASTGLSTGAKVGLGALLGLGLWKAGELVVKGVKHVAAKVRSKKQAKAKPERPADEFPTPEVEEGRFDD